jgi:hypothetical protein
MSLASTFNNLGQTTMPAVFSKVMPDTLTIKAESASSNVDGGRVKGTVSDYKTSVPCCYEPVQQRKSQRDGAGDKSISQQQYKVTIPTYQSGRITLNPQTMRFIVDARGVEPAKTFPHYLGWRYFRSCIRGDLYS